MFESVMGWDFQILNFIQEHLRNGFLDTVLAALSHAGKAGIIWIVCCVVMLFFKKTRAAGVIALVAMGIGYLLGDHVIKPLIARPRPFATESDLNVFRNAELIVSKPSGFSFPSGHSASAAAFATVTLAKNRVIGLIALLPVLLMMFSRLYLYVHFPSDVLSGAVLGILSAVLMLLIFRATKLDKKLSPRA